MAVAVAVAESEGERQRPVESKEKPVFADGGKEAVGRKGYQAGPNVNQRTGFTNPKIFCIYYHYRLVAISIFLLSVRNYSVESSMTATCSERPRVCS